MNWTIDQLENEQQQHTLVIQDEGFDAFKSAVVQCADKAFSMFNDTVLDSSMFCLFEWKAEEASLTIVVTDETKTQEGKHRVTVVLPAFRGELSEDFLEDLQAFIRDYLTTCLPFLQYSLIAAFSLDDRSRIKML
ncbi:hypothetical protein ACFOEK_01825 [Litoribrevibacter euphylliae]|uniref:Uncharacterized protein n=1 Tax=Litoribrevibacter euphylliae TaxID=1834034 RepID=A0ABV7H767_9GAMM